MKLILASSSPRRKRLMKRLNCSFDIIFPDVDESKIQFESSPEKYCISLAELKADKVSQDYPNALVIGADTIVFLDDHIMNKPHGHDEAEGMPIVRKTTQLRLNRILSNSFGFGGTNAALIFEKV